MEGYEINSFPKDTNPKMTVIARSEFELVYYDGAIQQVRHLVMGNDNYIFNVPVS